jgi:processive 1,2-diacylglycerol beta-glucosyltransferase
MPIHSAFRPSEDVFAEPVVLVSSGGIGAGPIYDVIRSLSQLNCKTVVVAGRNRELYEELLARNLPDSVEVLGHIKLEEMAAQMKRSCLLVGKPGGLTTFESLAVGLPMVVFKPFVIPGQEEDNCRFLVDAGAGLVVDSIESLTSTVCELLGEPGKLDSMREAAMRNSRPNAVAVILDELFGGNSTGYGGVSENGGDGTSR